MSAGTQITRVPIRREIVPASSVEETEMVRDHSGISWSTLAGLALWTVVVGMASAVAAIHISSARLQQALVMRPPVVVLNTMDWIQHAGTGDTPAARYSNGAAVLQATVAELKAHGALVLDASAVHSYPDAVRLDPSKPGSSGGQDGGVAK